jgi:acylphosphatase
MITTHARVHLIIRGRVQGVFFRASTVQQARDLGLTGWVMNRRDGSVEVLAEGPSDKVEELVSWCGQGPPRARVEGVELQRQEFRGEFTEFEVRKPTP